MQRDGGAAAPVEDRSRWRYSRRSRWRTGPDGTEERRHRWWTGADEDTRGVAGGVPDRRSGGTRCQPGRWWTKGPADQARSWSNGPAVERPEPELGIGESGSTHRWTAAACRPTPFTRSDSSGE